LDETPLNSDQPGHPYDLVRVGAAFALPGRMSTGRAFGDGHIHDTFLVEYQEAGTRRRFVHQRINDVVFQNPPQVMENITRVTEHLRARLERDGIADLDRRALRVLPARDGSRYHRDEAGLYWRTYQYVEGTTTRNSVASSQQAYEAAYSFARFQEQLTDLGSPRLHETIPGFHDTPRRMRRFREILAANGEGRASVCGPEIEFVLARAAYTSVLVDACASGRIPERIVHNDTKLNNVLLDESSGEGLCVVDLDTVMPGLVHYDFGDLVRTAACTTAEDSLELDHVEVNMDHYGALAAGYLAGTARFLTRGERETLVEAAPLITFETGLRFLTDFLEGDVYFKTVRAQHNLDRARVQFRLLESMERQRHEAERQLSAPARSVQVEPRGVEG